MRVLTVFLIAIFPLCALASAKKKTPLTVRFHTEVSARNTDTFAVRVQLRYPPRAAQVSKIPDISERDIVAIYPFQAPDGTAGCAFKLNEHGTLALDTLSIEKRGTSLVAVINGRQVTDLLIDKRVSDGVINLPGGLAAAEIIMLQKKFPTVGAGTKKTR